jgi:urea transport system permease protein
MVFLNWQELPWFWWGFDHFAWAAAMVILVPGLLALIFGWLAFRSRVTGVYLSIITQAMTYALMLAFFRNDMGFGGNNGMTDYKDILGWDVHQPATRLGLYLSSVAALGLGYLLCRYITSSKLGRVLLALRDAESRVRFLGYSVTSAKLFVFTVSAVLAGIAGALYVPQVGIINPSEFSPGNSIEIAIWVSVGGRGTLSGAIVGALLVNAAKTWLTGAAPETWLFVLGALFVATTLVFPRGIVGLLRQARWTRLRAPAPVAAGEQA